MPKMLEIKPLFKTVYRKLSGGLSIKPVGQELAHPGRRNVDCDLLAVPNSRPPDPLQEGRQRIIILIKYSTSESFIKLKSSCVVVIF